jgi:four helix bundle protein
MKTSSHQELIVWQKSMDYVQEIYQLTENFPSSEKFGLISQLRRAAVSIPSNIAEGRRRGTRKDFRRFLIMSYGSGAESETQIAISKRLGYISTETSKRADDLLSEVMRMLNKMIRSLQATS